MQRRKQIVDVNKNQKSSRLKCNATIRNGSRNW